MYKISAPGKLMLSGEWSVLERDVPCIVLAVQQRVYVTIRLAEETKIVLKNFNIDTKAKIEEGRIIFEKDDERLLFTKFAVEIALKYLVETDIQIKNFELTSYAEIISIRNTKTNQEMKVGFGSSAAAVVAIIGAVLKIHEVISFTEEDKEVIFKLGVIAHYFGQGKLGSGFDVAASTFGGVLVYKRFDPEWLQQELDTKSLLEVIYQTWPILEHWNLKLPDNLELMIGFTGTSASTRKLMKQMKIFKQDDPVSFQRIIEDIKKVTRNLIRAIQNEDQTEIIKLMNENRLLLEELSIACSCHLEIEEHRIMSKIAGKYGGVAKFSGAGGGDCSIGVCFHNEIKKAVVNEWKQRGIMPIDITISEEGVKIE
ncbi:MAG: phosphomevalonate kinase [Candidatus Hodarchaeota archaeon]